MAPRGRKPVPTKLKIIRRNPGRRKIVDPEPKPSLELPEPPEHLSVEAKIEWDRVAENLYLSGILAKIDRAGLAAYCQAYGRWVQAEAVISMMAEKDHMTCGLMIKTSNGNAVQNPLVGVANKAMSDMMRYAAEFGMTPSARSRIKAESREEENPYERLKRRA